LKEDFDNKTKSEKFVYLTTKGRKTGKDHVVELWFASSGGKIYLSHEGKHTDWIKNLIQGGNVKMKIGSNSFDGHARIADEGSSGREAGMKALYGKYYGPASREVLNDWFELSTVVEVELV
jgi:deazaflavin-dependent oxidoreductase (nitroreductase family)